MKFRYIGGEGLPGSGETFVFGRTVKVGEVCEFPPEFARKAQQNPAFELVEDKSEKPKDLPKDPPADPVVQVNAPRRGRPSKSTQ